MVNKVRAELEHFHDDSFVLVADYDNIVRELQKISGDYGELLEAGLYDYVSNYEEVLQCA